MTGQDHDARSLDIALRAPLGCFFGAHESYRRPGDSFARCDCTRPDDTGRVVPASTKGRGKPCRTCAAVGVFRWQDTCAASGHDERAAGCPGCGIVPAYRRRLADPWDTHDACPGCGYCHTHGRAA